MAGNTVKTFRCPACGGTIDIRAVGHTISAVCEHCSSVIDTANDNFKIIKKDHEANRKTDIPIGTKGVLDAVKWEVIGYVEKLDKASMSYWDEYLLFNPYFGFRFLIQSDGHWSLAAVIKRYLPLTASPSEAVLDGEKFSVYCRGQSRVEYVNGEFYWRIRKGDEENYTDYIAPPRMLSVERNKQEVTESVAEYLDPDEVANAFEIELPKRTGVAANQPPPFYGVLSSMWRTAVFAILAAMLTQCSSSSGTLVNTAQFHVVQGTGDKSFSTPVFNLPKRGNLLVKSTVPLRNSWMELDLSLVKEGSNEVFESRQVIEYYYGTDGGDYWSEGGQTGESVYSSVPAGNYRLVLDPSSEQIIGSGMDVSIEVRHNVAMWGNFWWIVFLIVILPLYAVIYRYYFEYKRWENSDYASAIYSGGESDD